MIITLALRIVVINKLDLANTTLLVVMTKIPAPLTPVALKMDVSILLLFVKIFLAILPNVFLYLDVRGML
jgi:hypothetical protein